MTNFTSPQKKVNNGNKLVKYFIGFIALILIFNFFDDDKVENKSTKKLTNEEYYVQNKSQVLMVLENRLKELNIRKVNELLEKYKNVKDKDLENFKLNLQQKKEEIKDNRTKEILTKLRKIPVSQYTQNYLLYKDLIDLHPNNKKYREKLDFYQAKIEKEKAKEALKKAFYGDIPIQSAWDGSYYPVEKYLKRVMHDPDSLKFKGCTKVFKQETGWMVGCQYRGKNAFGAMILNANWFTIRQGTVINVEPPNKYKW